MFLRALVNPNKSNCIVATQALLRALNIPVTTTTLTETLKEHPDYPSLLAINDALRQWRIDPICLRVEPGRIGELPIPFIAHIEEGEGQFAAVLTVTDKEITCCDYEKPGKSQIKSREDFFKIWNGVALLPQPTAQSGESDYLHRARKEFWRRTAIPMIMAGCALMVAVFFLSAAVPLNVNLVLLLSLILVKFTGTVLTGLLLWYEVDQSDPFLRQICMMGKKTNCKAVLQSREANLFGLITWSEIGFFYFAGSFLYILIALAFVPTVSLLAWFNILALPYTLFSIYYQWRVAKQWCPLCLAVQALLVTEFLLCYLLYWSQPVSHRLLFTYSILPAFLLPVFFWLFSKPFLLKSIAGEKYKLELNRLKRNGQIFDALLQRQKAIVTQPAGLGIILGNPEAANTIIKVCNPFCGPCAQAHPVIEELLRETEDVKVQIIFTAADDVNDRRAKPVKHLMALQGKNDGRLLRQALDDWYMQEKKDYDVFAGKYPLNGELKEQGQSLEGMYNWCREAGITGTPTFFINGRRLPDIYTIRDLKYFFFT
jgi:uncharacterized membrane protein/thiol-disulfide isomerase/thioredoxin